MSQDLKLAELSTLVERVVNECEESRSGGQEVRLFKIDGKGAFPLYGASGGLTTKVAVILRTQVTLTNTMEFQTPFTGDWDVEQVESDTRKNYKKFQDAITKAWAEFNMENL